MSDDIASFGVILPVLEHVHCVIRSTFERAKKNEYQLTKNKIRHSEIYHEKNLKNPKKS